MSVLYLSRHVKWGSDNTWCFIGFVTPTKYRSYCSIYILHNQGLFCTLLAMNSVATTRLECEIFTSSKPNLTRHGDTKRSELCHI